jgi:hypothetical protein
LIVVASFITIVWDVMQPALSSIIFVSAFSVAIAGSVMLGRTLGKRDLRSQRSPR